MIDRKKVSVLFFIIAGCFSAFGTDKNLEKNECRDTLAGNPRGLHGQPGSPGPQEMGGDLATTRDGMPLIGSLRDPRWTQFGTEFDAPAAVGMITPQVVRELLRRAGVAERAPGVQATYLAPVLAAQVLAMPLSSNGAMTLIDFGHLRLDRYQLIEYGSVGEILKSGSDATAVWTVSGPRAVQYDFSSIHYIRTMPLALRRMLTYHTIRNHSPLVEVLLQAPDHRLFDDIARTLNEWGKSPDTPRRAAAMMIAHSLFQLEWVYEKLQRVTVTWDGVENIPPDSSLKTIALNATGPVLIVSSHPQIPYDPSKPRTVISTIGFDADGRLDVGGYHDLEGHIIDQIVRFNPNFPDINTEKLERTVNQVSSKDLMGLLLEEPLLFDRGYPSRLFHSQLSLLSKSEAMNPKIARVFALAVASWNQSEDPRLQGLAQRLVRRTTLISNVDEELARISDQPIVSPAAAAGRLYQYGISPFEIRFLFDPNASKWGVTDNGTGPRVLLVNNSNPRKARLMFIPVSEFGLSYALSDGTFVALGIYDPKPGPTLLADENRTYRVLPSFTEQDLGSMKPVAQGFPKGHSGLETLIVGLQDLLLEFVEVELATIKPYVGTRQELFSFYQAVFRYISEYGVEERVKIPLDVCPWESLWDKRTSFPPHLQMEVEMVALTSLSQWGRSRSDRARAQALLNFYRTLSLQDYQISVGTGSYGTTHRSIVRKDGGGSHQRLHLPDIFHFSPEGWTSLAADIQRALIDSLGAEILAQSAAGVVYNDLIITDAYVRSYLRKNPGVGYLQAVRDLGLFFSFVFQWIQLPKPVRILALRFLDNEIPRAGYSQRQQSRPKENQATIITEIQGLPRNPQPSQIWRTILETHGLPKD